MWQEARRRARAETLDLIRLNDPWRALLTIGVPFIAIAVSWYMTGQVAYTALAAFAASLAFGLFVYMMKILLMPATIAQEERQQRRALEDIQAIRADKDRIARQLMLFVDEAKALKRRLSETDPPTSNEVKGWVKKVRDYIKGEIGYALANKFDDDTGLDMMPTKRIGSGINVRAPKDSALLDRRISRLNEIIDRFA